MRDKREGQRPTSTQLQVVQLAASGASDATIAARMFISESTVRRRLRELKVLVRAPDRAALCVEAARRGWLEAA